MEFPQATLDGARPHRNAMAPRRVRGPQPQGLEFPSAHSPAREKAPASAAPSKNSPDKALRNMSRHSPPATGHSGLWSLTSDLRSPCYTLPSPRSLHTPTAQRQSSPQQFPPSPKATSTTRSSRQSGQPIRIPRATAPNNTAAAPRPGAPPTPDVSRAIHPRSSARPAPGRSGPAPSATPASSPRGTIRAPRSCN